MMGSSSDPDASIAALERALALNRSKQGEVMKEEFTLLAQLEALRSAKAASASMSRVSDSFMDGENVRVSFAADSFGERVNTMSPFQSMSRNTADMMRMSIDSRSGIDSRGRLPEVHAPGHLATVYSMDANQLEARLIDTEHEPLPDRCHFAALLDSDRLAQAAALVLTLVAVAAIPITAAGDGSLGGAWVSDAYPCYVTSVGVICNNSRMEYPNDTRYNQFEDHKRPIWYVTTLIFSLLVAGSVVFHSWRLRELMRRRFLGWAPADDAELPPAASHTACAPLHTPLASSAHSEELSKSSLAPLSPPASPPPASLASSTPQSHPPPPISPPSLPLPFSPPFSPPSPPDSPSSDGGAKLPYGVRALLDLYCCWTQPLLAGLLVGAVMAFYQFVLNCAMNSLWQNSLTTEALPEASAFLSPTGYASRRWAVILLPALGLCAANGLQRHLESGAAGTFVAAVNKNLTIDPFKGLVATSVVSIVAIMSGGSAGPEGPVLFIGATIGVRSHAWILGWLPLIHADSHRCLPCLIHSRACLSLPVHGRACLSLPHSRRLRLPLPLGRAGADAAAGGMAEPCHPRHRWPRRPAHRGRAGGWAQHRR